MLEVVANRSAVASAQKRFSDALKKEPSFEHYRTTLGYRGGHLKKATVYWSDKYQFWHTHKVIESDGGDRRHWNAFGTEKPEGAWSRSITCEINFPVHGPNWRVAGAILKDKAANLFVGHTGKIGGGTEGVGKALFVRHFKGTFELAFDGTKEIRIARVAALDSPHFLRQLSNFVQEVGRIKAIARGEVNEINLPQDSEDSGYSDEFEGTVNRQGKSIIEATYDHGTVVNQLKRILEKKGHRVSNTKHCDLRVIRDEAVRFQFEVKTSNDSQNIYAAIGQLLFHSSHLQHRPRLILVSPASIGEKERKILAKLRIKHLAYEWLEDKPRFQGLSFLGL